MQEQWPVLLSNGLQCLDRCKQIVVLLGFTGWLVLVGVTGHLPPGVVL